MNVGLVFFREASGWPEGVMGEVSWARGQRNRCGANRNLTQNKRNANLTTGTESDKLESPVTENQVTFRQSGSTAFCPSGQEPTRLVVQQHFNN